MELYDSAVDVLTNPKHSRWVTNCLIAGEVALTGLIIWKIPYTEIDWKTYMQQIDLFVHGEMDYAKIRGDTGPLVYPAFHVYLYSALYYLTNRGKNIVVAQGIFGLLYLTTVVFVMACYKKVGAPPWLLVPLVLSKRLHSIFMLRLFNDGWGAFFFWVSIWALQHRDWSLGALAWGFGLGIKMTLLLATPAVSLILIQGAGIAEAFFLGTYVGFIQGIAAFPFLTRDIGFTYFQQAFDFGRQFLFRWTVNWRFLGGDIFASRGFTISLLAVHISILVYFVQTRWIKPSSASVLGFIRKHTGSMDSQTEEAISNSVTPTFVMDAMLGSMIIGMLCARSLHYQFYAYLGWATPYLLWRAGFGPVWVLSNWAIQEYCWLVYPSTRLSSLLVVLELAVQVFSIWSAGPAVLEQADSVVRADAKQLSE